MAGEQILVVEDQRAVAGALQMRLRGLGYDVAAIARDGFEAIEKATLLQPDLILMDIKLGEGMDGIEAAEEIRAQTNIPVVFVSAYADRDLLNRARHTQPAGFINKPFTTRDLLTTIDLALHNWRDRYSNDAPKSDRSEDQQESLVTADVDGRINYVSAKAERRLGLRRNQLAGKPIVELIVETYRLDPVQAAKLFSSVIERGGEEALHRERQSQAGGNQMADVLTPMRDAQGSILGAALKFSTLIVKSKPNAQTGALAKALDALPVGVLLVNEDLRVVHLNNYAQEIINHNKGLQYNNERLSARDKQIDEKLHQLVKAAAEKVRLGIEDGSDAMFIKAPMIRDQVEIIATPASNPGKDKTDILVILYLFDASLDRVVSGEVLTRLYGLTQTEARLVQLLIGGETLDGAATTLKITVNTARTHLKHVFHKTGINRQAELVHRIETGPAGLLVKFNDGH